ncbi:hypothetical protein [Massilia endophytica]|uniref:hypothetical protein n=1 Tax=Massilia endophytica TaxID=2899220 RepID=UPI001E558C38|nr:hypothetical protein [Massilia endophytica]UGQ46844.1 hypothetical protein LSQ66_24300 [Massilia endophytica]
MPREKNGCTADALLDWYVVPWGPNPASGALRFSIRIMPKERPWGASVLLADWPAALAKAGDVQLEFRTSPTVAAAPVAADLGQAYRRYLAECRISVEQASQLWEAVFGDLFAAMRAEPLDVAAASQGIARRSFVWSHSPVGMVRSAITRFGALYANALENASRSAAFVGQPSLYVAAGAPTGESVEHLYRAASMFSRAGSPRRALQEQLQSIASRQGKSGTAGEAVQALSGQNWWGWRLLSQAVAAEGGNSQDLLDSGKQSGTPLTVPYTETYLDFLLTRGSDPLGKPHGIGAGDEDAMDDFAVHLASRKYMYGSPGPDEGLALLAKARPGAEKEFCTRVAALAAHPWLVKVLGLVVGMEAAPGLPLASVKAFGVSGVSWEAGALPDCVAEPHLTALRNGFPQARTASSGKEYYHGGLLNVAPRAGDKLLTQFDLDRSPDRYVQAAISYRTQRDAGGAPDDAAVELQGEESVGYALIEEGKERKDLLFDRTKMPMLYLEHLLAGYRPDVRDMSAGTGWQPLTARRIRRVLIGKHRKDITHWFERLGRCEAFITEKTRTARQPDGVQSHIESEMFRWGTQGLAGSVGQEKSEDFVVNPADGHGQAGELSIEYAPADVPPQRFGHAYRFGVRLAMVDGNSLAMEEAAALYERANGMALTIGEQTTDVPASQQAGQVCHRYERLAPPAVLLTKPLEPERFPNENARRLLVASSADHARVRHKTSRILVPPRSSSIDLCLRHGALDPFRNQASWPSSAFPGVALTEEGDFPSRKTHWTDKDGKAVTSTDQYFEEKPFAGDGPDVPYYPDPWARVAVCGLYRKGDDRLLDLQTFDYYHGGRRWPDCRPMRLVLRAVDSVEDEDAGFDARMDAEGLTISALPGVQVVLRVWHAIGLTEFRHFALTEQLADIATKNPAQAGFLPALTESAEASPREQVARMLAGWGRGQMGATSNGMASASFWMANPFLELSLLHAVDLPVASVQQLPGYGIGILRTTGETKARFQGRLALHRPSTSRIFAQATWADLPNRAQPDGGRGYRWPGVWRNGELFSVARLPIVAADESGIAATIPMDRQPEAFQRYQDLAAEWPDKAADPASRRRVSGEFDFGDTRARALRVVTGGAARHAEEFAGLNGEQSRRLAAPFRLVVEATERPPRPVIDYIMPMLSWEDQLAPPDQSRRARQGGWFRIWLGEQWYNSGNGELLALLCWTGKATPPPPQPIRSMLGLGPADLATPPAALEPLVSRWGLDPLAGQEIEFGNMPAAALLNRLKSQAELRASGGPADMLDIDLHHLKELSDFSPKLRLSTLSEYKNVNFGTGQDASEVMLALYRPVMDRASGRMHVDIRIDPALAYQPFVRLSMARYQLHAPSGAENLQLSPIVATEFVQLLPGRVATLASQRDRHGVVESVRVTVSGTTLPAGGRATLKTMLFASIEQREVGFSQASDEEGDGAWTPVSAQADSCALQPGQEDNSWWTLIPFRSRVSHEYSVRIEEYETIAGAATQSRRLVYFDRIPLRHF